MKNLKKIFKLILILIITLNTIPIYVNAVDTLPEKGDLRCPPNSTNCKVTKEENGKVMEVEVTKQSGDYTVSKIVSRTSTKGKVKISFNVKGPGNKTVYSDPAYVILILDKSSSIKNEWEVVKSAAIDFANNLINLGNHVSIIVFSNWTKNVTNGFISQNITSFSEGDVEFKSSHIEKSFYQAYQLLNNNENIPLNANKYIVVFGDGQYSYNYMNSGSANINTCVDGSANILTCNGNCMRNTINYNDCHFSGYDSPYIYLESELSKLKTLPNTKVYSIIYNNNQFQNAQERWMSYISSTNQFDCDARNGGDSYKRCFDNIMPKIQKTETIASAKLYDTLGGMFKKGSSNKKEYSWNIDNLNNNGIVIPNSDFEITIKKSEIKESGWYETNKKFELKVGDTTIITSTDNPEIYWEAEPKDLLSCTSTAYLNDSSSIDKEYYTKTCLQTDDSKVTVSVNNLGLGEKSFSLTSGAGFPSTIDISNHIKCSYSFNLEKYNNDYNNYQTRLKTATSKREINSVQGLIDELNKSLESYNNMVNYSSKNNINSDLKSYIDNLNKIVPKLNVKYYKTSKIDSIEYINDGNIEKKSLCTNSKTSKVLGTDKNIIINQECTLDVVKKMQLPSSCIDIVKGDAVLCNSKSNTQLNGGNSFYPNMQYSGGLISIEIPSEISYFKQKIILDGNIKDNGVYRCSYEMDEEKDVQYRIIDVTDPFLTNFSNKTRSIGTNWKNNKYNFTKIIKSDTWTNNPEYTFKISKVNIQNIVKSTLTDNEKASSYLGNDCYITSSNKYVCNFLRNKNESGDILNFYSSKK